MIVRSEYLIRLFFIIALAIGACSGRLGKQPWWSAVPADSPVVVLHHGANFFDVLEMRQSSFLGEIGAIDIVGIAAMQQRVNTSLPTKAVALFPTGSHELQPVFILENSRSVLDDIASMFREDFAVNNYRFRGRKVHILHLENQQLFATQLHDWILLSKNSAAIENGIMTYSGNHPGISVTEEEIAGGDFLLNTPKLNNWVQQLGAPRFLPRFKNLFDGTGPAVITISNETDDDPFFDLTLSGTIPLTQNEPSDFVSTFIQDPAPFDLDRYIPVDAALFSVYHNYPSSPSGDDTSVISKLDSLLITDSDRFDAIAHTLAPATAFVVFEASGFLSVGEHMFIRRLEDTAAFNRQMSDLVREGYIEENNNIFHVSSNIMARLLGGPVNRFTDFFIMRSANGAIVTKRAGLARRVDQDQRRRAVYFYEDEYMEARQRHPDNVSTWIYSRSAPLLNYLDPLLNPVNHAGFLGTLMDVGAASFVRNGDQLSFQLDTYFSEDRQEPVRDLWVYPLDGSQLTGNPLLANIVGGSRDELIFATESNRVFGVASDGTGFLEVQTGNDRPIGSPIVYDWYGNNQNAILIAAGNKVYAWNSRGIPLPNFPVSMDETITAPLAIADVSRNGNPEIIVVTADRKVHVLDQRGLNIQGWPQDVNVQVTRQPIFRIFDGEPTLWVTAGNGLFGFTPQGERRDNFPVFIESEFGPITFHENQILSGASDGHLYAIGKEPFFDDTHIADTGELDNIEHSDGELEIRRVYVGNAPIINAPIVQTLTIDHDGEERIRERMIGVQNLNGNLFLLNEAGQLRMTRNMGQNAADYDNMLITDLNGNGKPDMVGISSTGRIYAWQIESGESLSDLPTASMRHPIAADIYVNGEIELIGQTRDGLHCWSFRRP